MLLLLWPRFATYVDDCWGSKRRLCATRSFSLWTTLRLYVPLTHRYVTERAHSHTRAGTHADTLTSKHGHTRSQSCTVWRVQLQRVCIFAFHCRRVPATATATFNSCNCNCNRGLSHPSPSKISRASLTLSSNRRVWLNNSNNNKNK